MHMCPMHMCRDPGCWAAHGAAVLRLWQHHSPGVTQQSPATVRGWALPAGCARARAGGARQCEMANCCTARSATRSQCTTRSAGRQGEVWWIIGRLRKRTRRAAGTRATRQCWHPGHRQRRSHKRASQGRAWRCGARRSPNSGRTFEAAQLGDGEPLRRVHVISRDRRLERVLRGGGSMAARRGAVARLRCTRRRAHREGSPVAMWFMQAAARHGCRPRVTPPRDAAACRACLGDGRQVDDRIVVEQAPRGVAHHGVGTGHGRGEGEAVAEQLACRAAQGCQQGCVASSVVVRQALGPNKQASRAARRCQRGRLVPSAAGQAAARGSHAAAAACGGSMRPLHGVALRRLRARAPLLLSHPQPGLSAPALQERVSDMPGIQHAASLWRRQL